MIVRQLNCRLLTAACLVSMVSGNQGRADDTGFEKIAWQFFDQHCLECHDDITAKGGLDLGVLDGKMKSASAVETWTLLFDRVKSGEMPPPDEPRPAAESIDQLLKWIVPRLTTADRDHREVVQRRLNREEYQNTIRDLLAVDVDIIDLLPEDQRAGGFDNNGEALAISAELMERYLEAARTAINAAIVLTPRPETVTFIVDSIDEVERYFDSHQYALVGDRVVSFLTPRAQYSKVSTRKIRTPERGRYRFRFNAATYRSDRPLVFSVVASDFAPVAAKFHNLGYFEARSTPKEFVIEAILDRKSAIQFFPLGLPTWIKEPAKGDHPGIGIGPVEVTGPIVDEWPPVSHQRIFSDVDPATATLEDARGILADFAARAFRRPLEDDEVETYLHLVGERLTAGRDFVDSLKVGLTAVLCSPNFLYLREVESEAGESFVSDHELATRLAYFLTSSMPDDSLAERARSGELANRETLVLEVERLLDDSASEEFVERFVAQWLHLREIEDTTPDRKLYPDFDELLQVSMVREGEAFFRYMIDEDLPIRNFLDSDFLMLNGRLARHYGIEGVEGWELRPVEIPDDSPRGGVLTQAGVLKVTANGTNTSPVMRGVWVLENILGQPTPPPPPNIEGIEPDIRGATTIREQLDLHRNAESCAVCHRSIDPPGFALESFDPVGAYRDKYKRFVVSNPEKGWGSVQDGADVDASGVTSEGRSFAGIVEFKTTLIERESDFAGCLAEKLLAYGLGRELGFSDRPAVAEIVAQSLAQGGGLRTLIHNIVGHDIFRTR